MTRADLGVATEARFILDASRLGFRVSKPFSESPGYDFILDSAGKLLRVQVKGARRTVVKGRNPYYAATITRRGQRGPRADILAIYLEDDSRWAFFPKSFLRRKQLRIYPGSKHLGRSWDIFTR